jgi:1-acyl-sn-glycerol-3-phosphate acyltransferase
MSQTLGKSETAPTSQSAPQTTAPHGNDELSQPVKRSAFSYIGFNKLFAGSLSATLGDRIYQMALIAAANIIFLGGDSEKNATRVQIIGTIPGVIFYAATSSMIDTFDRRRLMMFVQGLKIFAVLALIPLLWNTAKLDDDAAIRAQLVDLWPWCLAAVFMLNLISVPFSPARAAAVPDVLPIEHRSVGASLMATTGLISLLIGTGLGGVLARRSVLGPAKMIILSSILYLIGTLYFSKLPDAVAVPGNRRSKENQPAAEEKEGFYEYLRGLYAGIVYCLKHWSVLGLTFFETVFWTVASAFNFLFQVHLRTALKLSADDKTTFFGLGLGCAGIGLFGGAIGIGKICKRVSPILTYTPAFVLIGVGLWGVFSSQADPDGHVPSWIYPIMFSLGLGGGLVLGRVDADVLATTEDDIRGRVFSLKAMAFAISTLVTMVSLSELNLEDSTKADIARWLPRGIFISIPIVFLLSWSVDMAIWSKKADVELPGAFHRFGYRICRLILRATAGILFRFRIEGAENIPKEGPVVLAANHGSFADPPLMGCGIERLVQYIIYSTYYRSPAHPLFRFLRCIPVDEHDHLGALKATVRSLNQGACIGIFPEGRITYDGKMNPPQRGALFVAQRSGALVVPVAIKGNFDAWPRTKILPRFRKPITIIYGKPFPVPKELTKKEVADLTDKMMAELAQKLELPPPPKSGDAPLESSITPPKE